jgi:ABC-type multidrug transport system ATPase subunit
MSTHLMVEAERLCDRVAIILGGRIRAVGALDALRSADDAGLEEVFVRLTQDHGHATAYTRSGADGAGS